MKRIVSVLLAIGMLSGCGANSEDMQVSTQTQESSVIERQPDIESEAVDSSVLSEEDYTKILVDAIKKSECGFRDNLKHKVKPEDFNILWEQQCNIVKGERSKCMLFSYHDNFGVVGIPIDNRMYFHYLGDEFYACDNMFAADIDGDGLDEIMAHFYTNSAIGPSRASTILKFERDEFRTLLCADSTNIDASQINWVDSGFELKFQDGYKSMIKNTITGSEIDIPLENELNNTIFDQDGNVNGSHPMYGIYFEKDKSYPNANSTHNYLVFKTIDFDDDGIYEIMTANEFIFSFQMAISLGLSYTIQKYDVLTGTFNIVKSDFFPYSDNKGFEDRYTFEDNWYKRLA